MVVVDTLAELFHQNQESVDNNNNNTILHLEGDPHDHDDLFSIFDSLESVAEFTMIEDETELDTSPKSKRLKTTSGGGGGVSSSEEPNNGAQRISHITVERNRRKQMNEHLSVLKSLMPCFYVKKGDQASIIGGVVEYIKELQQVLQSLEAKKQRKLVYSEVLSPRPPSSCNNNNNNNNNIAPLSMSPRKPPLSTSPRLNLLPMTPTTPQQQQQQATTTTTTPSSLELASSSSSSSPCNNNNNNIPNDLVASSKTAMAEVEVKFTGPNVILKTVSPPIPGQAAKIISALQQLSLQILHVKITTVHHTMFNSFTIKIGIECQLSAEELAQQIQQTFC